MIEQVPPAFEVGARDLRDALNRVKHAAADDDGRPILATILMDRIDETTVRLAAADNYRIAIARLNVLEVSDDWPQTILPVRDLPVLLALLTATHKASAVRIEHIGSQRVRATTSAGSVEVRLFDGMYPDLTIVTGPAAGAPEVFAVNAKYLMEAGKAGGSEAGIARVSIRDRLSPIVVTSDDDYIEYIMPVKTLEAAEAMRPEPVEAVA